MAQNKRAAPSASTSGIAAMGDLSALLAAPKALNSGSNGPLMLSVEKIEEDASQPRTVFDDTALAELSESIRLRGVKTPISVRPHHELPDTYIINHGARRYRASLLANQTTIPAFVDADYSLADQVVENLQREGLTSREIADYIGRELASGKKQAEIAREISKSRAYVSQHATLLDLPFPIAKVFNDGSVTDVTLINDLVVLYRQYPKDMDEWFASPTTVINRESVRNLRMTLKEEDPAASSEALDAPRGKAKEEGKKSAANAAQETNDDPTKLKKAIVSISHDGRDGRLVLSKRPSEEGRVWIKYDDNGAEEDVPVEEVSLSGIVEG